MPCPSTTVDPMKAMLVASNIVVTRAGLAIDGGWGADGAEDANGVVNDDFFDGGGLAETDDDDEEEEEEEEGRRDGDGDTCFEVGTRFECV